MIPPASLKESALAQTGWLEPFLPATYYEAMMQLKNPKHSVFSGRRALIVGGTGGIGYAVAKELAARGAVIILHGREQSRCSQARSHLLEAYPSARIRCWVHEFAGTPAFMDALEALLQEEGEEPDIVVCAFGPLLTGKLEDMTAAAWSLLADANLALPGALASRCMAAWKARNFGRLLLFGGTRTDSIRPFRNTAAYAAAKIGLGVLTRSVAIEGAPADIAAITVCPGPVRTEYLTETDAVKWARLAAGGRLLEPEEVASAALDLLDESPCRASGAIIAMDGPGHIAPV